MKVFALVCTIDTDDGWGSNVWLFLDKQKAQNKMREVLEDTIKCWNFDTSVQTDKHYSELEDDVASLVDETNVVIWEIEEEDLPVQVAIEVKGGLVQNIYANTDIDAEVYDLDMSDYYEDEEVDIADEREQELRALVSSDGWRSVY